MTDVHHFHRGNGRLAATSVAHRDGDGLWAVGIARAHKNEKRASRVKGRELALARLMRGEGFTTLSVQDKALRVGEAINQLFVYMSDERYQEFIKGNPFREFGCQYGATPDSLLELQKMKALQKAEAATRKIEKNKKSQMKKTTSPKKTSKKTKKTK